MHDFSSLGLIVASSQYVSALSHSSNDDHRRDEILEREESLTNSLSEATEACKKFLNDIGDGDRLQEIKVNVEKLMKDIKNSNDLSKEDYEKLDEAGQALIDELQKMIALETNEEIKSKLSFKQKNLKSKLKMLREMYSSPNTSRTDLHNFAQDFGKLMIQDIDLITGLKQFDELSEIGGKNINSANLFVSQLCNLTDEKLRTEQMKNSLGTDQVSIPNKNRQEVLGLKKLCLCCWGCCV